MKNAILAFNPVEGAKQNLQCWPKDNYNVENIIINIKDGESPKVDQHLLTQSLCCVVLDGAINDMKGITKLTYF